MKASSFGWIPSSVTRALAEEADDELFAAYMAAFHGQRLGLIEGERKRWFDEDRACRTRFVTLARLNEDGSVAFRFPEVAGLDSLLEEARFRSANVDEFLEGILGRADEHQTQTSNLPI